MNSRPSDRSAAHPKPQGFALAGDVLYFEANIDSSNGADFVFQQGIDVNGVTETKSASRALVPPPDLPSDETETVSCPWLTPILTHSCASPHSNG
jgi:hypothetical protein